MLLAFVQLVLGCDLEYILYYVLTIWAKYAPSDLRFFIGLINRNALLLLKHRQSCLFGPFCDNMCFLLCSQYLSVQPKCFCFFVIQDSITSILHFPSTPLVLLPIGGFALSLALLSVLLWIKKRVLVLPGVVFSIKLYHFCHLARHMHNK